MTVDVLLLKMKKVKQVSFIGFALVLVATLIILPACKETTPETVVETVVETVTETVTETEMRKF